MLNISGIYFSRNKDQGGIVIVKSPYQTTADLFRRTDFMLRRCIEKKLRALDEEIYRSQHRLLMHLGKEPDCSQNELAARLDISPAAVAVSLNKLEKGGYIERKTNSDDHRSNRVAITEKGDRMIRSSIRFFEEIDCGMFEGFSQEEMEQFRLFLERAHRNLGKMQAETALDRTTVCERKPEETKNVEETKTPEETKETGKELTE